MEIERKFLVSGDFYPEVFKSFRISQGYLCADPARTVRVRIRDDKGFLTVKGPSNETGVSRFEWEKEIPVEDASQLLELCLPARIDKTRHLVRYAGHVFEVDVFHAENEGLVLAEVELGSEDEAFERPDWLGPEVSGDPRYYNSYLAAHPFRSWK